MIPDLEALAERGERPTETRQMSALIHGSAEFSACGKHRLRLDRWWGDGPRTLVCGCNPSDAGAERNDPTIHRLNALLRSRCDGYTMVNFGTFIGASPADFSRWRETAWRDDPDYRTRRDANLAAVAALAVAAPLRIVAWGNLVPQVPDATKILGAMSLGYTADLHAFGVTKDGSPKHPMARGHHRIPDSAELVVWKRAHREAALRQGPGG